MNLPSFLAAHWSVTSDLAVLLLAVLLVGSCLLMEAALREKP